LTGIIEKTIPRSVAEGIIEYIKKEASSGIYASIIVLLFVIVAPFQIIRENLTLILMLVLFYLFSSFDELNSVKDFKTGKKTKITYNVKMLMHNELLPKEVVSRLNFNRIAGGMFFWFLFGVAFGYLTSPYTGGKAEYLAELEKMTTSSVFAHVLATNITIDLIAILFTIFTGLTVLTEVVLLITGMTAGTVAGYGEASKILSILMMHGSIEIPAFILGTYIAYIGYWTKGRKKVMYLLLAVAVSVTMLIVAGYIESHYSFPRLVNALKE